MHQESKASTIKRLFTLNSRRPPIIKDSKPQLWLPLIFNLIEIASTTLANQATMGIITHRTKEASRENKKKLIRGLQIKS